MRNKLLLILTLVILTGCSPQRRLARLLERFPPDITTTIEYRDTTIYKDTTLYKYLPGDTVWDEIVIETPVQLPDTAISLTTSLAQATASLENNRLGLRLTQLDSIFQWKLDSALVTNIDTVLITNDVSYPEIEKVKPFYKNGFFILAGLILIGLVLFFVFRK